MNEEEKKALLEKILAKEAEIKELLRQWREG